MQDVQGDVDVLLQTDRAGREEGVWGAGQQQDKTQSSELSPRSHSPRCWHAAGRLLHHRRRAPAPTPSQKPPAPAPLQPASPRGEKKQQGG